MDFLKIDKKIKRIWYISTTIVFILCLGACVATQFIAGIILPLLIAEVIVMLILAFFCYVFPAMFYNRYSYAYNDKRIVIRKGVIFKYEIIIPVCQIQDLHLLQGPLMQLMKLQSIEISTAGSNYTINGLQYDVAKKMVDDLENNLNARIEEIKNEEVF